MSGSGKSTLVNDVILRALKNRLHNARLKSGMHGRIEGIEMFDKVIDIDQSPIGRTPRSNPATYTGLFDHIRQLYASTPDSKVRGYKPGRFSFNVKGGRCETCRGDGTIKIEMHFLPDVYVPCEVCKGKRYNRETLEVRFKGKSIADVLEMPVEEALEFFAKIPKLRRRLQTLHDVGLDYVRLGQPATTLSGGEAQRVKLATELQKIATGRTLYVLDEPTTGLHLADIEKLLEVLHRLVESGNTVLVIEHNLDVIKQADWVVDLGPEGGDAGGEVIAAGPPEEIVLVPESHTGRFLRPLLEAPREVKATAQLVHLARQGDDPPQRPVGARLVHAARRLGRVEPLQRQRLRLHLRDRVGRRGLQRVAHVVVQVGGLGAAGRDLVHVDVEDRGRQRRQVEQARLLARLAQRGLQRVVLALVVAAELQPAVEAPVVVQQHAARAPRRPRTRCR